jgi:hypothetical protein
MEDDILFCVGVSKLFWIFRTAATWFLVIGIVYLPDAVSLPSRTIWLKAYDEQRVALMRGDVRVALSLIVEQIAPGENTSQRFEMCRDICDGLS